MREKSVVLLVRDFLSGSRIEQASAALGLKTIVPSIEGLEDSNADFGQPNKLGEPISGPDGDFFSLITRWQPVLIIMDMGEKHYPWERWLSLLKSSPATRRIPILCFGPHIETEKLQRARELNADVVVPRSKFFKDLLTLLSETARGINRKKIASLCRESMSDAARRGIHEFNEGNYFEAHEFLEDAWNEDGSEGRDLYRAVLQVAVAYLQIERVNFAGAVKMILRSRQWFAPLPDVCRGINVKLLRKDAENVYNMLNTLGPDAIAEFDLSMLRPVELVE